jgi:hypothetical protein
VERCKSNQLWTGSAIASTMLTLTLDNTDAPSIMIGERASDLVLKDCA